MWHHDEETYLNKLKSLRANIDWEVEEARHEISREFFSLIIEGWRGRLPNLGEIFRREEMDWFIVEYLSSFIDYDTVASHCFFIEFLIRAGYKDEPELDEDGKPVLLRTTPVHYAGKAQCHMNYPDVFDNLFKIYDRYDVNYTDESGLSHFHVACEYGCRDVAQKFLELGQNPNVIWRETGDSPLHLVLRKHNQVMMEFMLKNNADPNLANNDGFTPLHLIFHAGGDATLSDLIDITVTKFFMINDEKHQLVQIDAKDKLGRTPLQWAVANLVQPDVINLLLKRGADFSSFVFPSETYFGSRYQHYQQNHNDNEAIGFVASKTLDIVECIKKRGYELDRRDALTIMKFFGRLGLFRFPLVYEEDDVADEDTCAICGYRDKATELFCRWHKSVILSVRRFFQRWALEFFLTLTRQQLPILCCEKILEKLENENLLMMCVATETATKEQSLILDVQNKVEEIEEIKNLLITE